MMSFVMLMALNPDVQRCSQAEIDKIVGRDRNPSASDISQFDYLMAVMKEVLRSAPVAPFGA